MSRKTRIITTLLVLVVLLVLLIVGLKQGLLGNLNSKNTPVVDISELTWTEGPYRIFFLGYYEHGLYSMYVDGSQKKMIHEDANGYHFLKKSNQILTKTKTGVYTFNLGEDRGAEIYNATPYKKIGGWKISPGEEYLAIELFDNRRFDDDYDDGKYYSNEVVIVNLSTRGSRTLSAEKDLGNYQYLQRYVWSANSQSLFLRVRTFNDSGKGTDTYYAYQPRAGFINKLGMEESLSDSKKMKGLGYFTGGVGTIETMVYRYNKPVSDDDRVVAILYSGEVLVDDEPVMFWLSQGFKFDSICRYAMWLPDDEHFLLSCGGTIRIVEPDTKIVAKLADGVNYRLWDY